MSDRRSVYHHQGYLMRSYTELMWARVLEAVDIFYLYEPHMQQVDGGKYLPDFYLPNVGIYIEVKGCSPTDDEIRKADDVTALTGKPVVFLVGMPQSDVQGLLNCGILAKGLSGWTSNVSPYDLSCLVRDHVGVPTWARLIRAARPEPMDDVRRISEIAEEYFVNLMERHDMESYRRMQHKRANEERRRQSREISVVERGLSFWFDRQAARQMILEQPQEAVLVSAGNGYSDQGAQARIIEQGIPADGQSARALLLSKFGKNKSQGVGR